MMFNKEILKYNFDVFFKCVYSKNAKDYSIQGYSELLPPPPQKKSMFNTQSFKMH